MSKKKKRKIILSDAVRKKEASMVYTPVIRNRSNGLNYIEIQKLNHSFLETWEGVIWEQTSNLKINCTKKAGCFYLRCLRHECKTSLVGRRVESKAFTILINDENNAFDF